MPRSHKKLWIEAVLWVIAEIILSSSSLNTIANYGEFLLNQSAANSSQTVVTDTTYVTLLHQAQY